MPSKSFRGWPVVDARHRASTKNAPDLSPRGGFTIELWIKPKPEIDGYPDSFLIDNRYVDNSGYQLILTRELSPDIRQLNMLLGFGKDYDTFVSTRSPAKWGSGITSLSPTTVSGPVASSWTVRPWAPPASRAGAISPLQRNRSSLATESAATTTASPVSLTRCAFAEVSWNSARWGSSCPPSAGSSAGWKRARN